MTEIDRLALLKTVAAPILAEQRTERERQIEIREVTLKQIEDNWHTVTRFLGLVGVTEYVRVYDNVCVGDVMFNFDGLTDEFRISTPRNNSVFIKIPNHTEVRDVCGEPVTFTVYTPDEVFRQAVARALIELGIIKE